MTEQLVLTKIKVVIYEDGEEVRELMVGYFPGQPYTVTIDTPDGVDRQYEGQVSKVPAQLR